MMKKILTGLFSVVLTLCLLLASVPALAAEPLPDLSLTDQYGNTHNLADYAGKIVFLNFWATWCPPCVAEMPEFEELYHELGENQDDVVILGIAGPSSVDSEDEAGIAAFLKENNITYPVLMDANYTLWGIYPSEFIPYSLFFLPDGTAAQITLPDSTTGDMIVGGIDKEYFLTTLNAVQESLQQE